MDTREEIRIEAKTARTFIVNSDLDCPDTWAELTDVRIERTVGVNDIGQSIRHSTVIENGRVIRVVDEATLADVTVLTPTSEVQLLDSDLPEILKKKR